MTTSWELENYFQLEGLAYRLVPYETKSFDGQTGTVEVEKMYDRLVNNLIGVGLAIVIYILMKQTLEWS